MTGCRGHVINAMSSWITDGRFLKYWIYFCSLFTLCVSTGVLEIRFDQYHVQYTSQNAGHHAGSDPSTVSLAPTQIWDEVTPSTPQESNVTTPSVLPDAWRNSPTCSSPSRYRFLICMDIVGRPEQCALGREDSGLFQVTQGMISPNGDGNDIVVFGDMLRGMPNPLQNPIMYNFPTWPGSIQVNAYVQCCGATDTERCEEKLSGLMSVIPVTGQNNMPTRVNITNQGSAALLLSVTVRCSVNFYGVNCSTFCRNDNQLNDRVCHPVTGQLVCRPGFTGSDCDEDLNECDLGVCRHGAGCNNVHGTFTCHCLKGSSGRLCENRTPTCPSGPCSNGGTCEENMDSVDFLCKCPAGWKGKQCETVDPVTTTPSHRIGNEKAISKEDEGAATESTDNDWTIWYVGIALLALTVIVIIILIICVVWTSRRRRYHISELAKPEPPVSTVATVASQSQFDNIVYLHDPEDIDLQPPSSSLYQRTLVPDDPYMNERPLYQDRITPDTPYDDGDDICVSRRQGVAARDNVYSTMGNVNQPEEAYEAINISGQDGQPKDILPSSELSPTYRRASDPVPYSIFDFCNPTYSDDDHLQKNNSNNLNSNGNIPTENQDYERLAPVNANVSRPEQPGSHIVPEPIYNRGFFVQSKPDSDTQTDRRPSEPFSTASDDSRMSSQPHQDTSPSTEDPLMTYANHDNLESSDPFYFALEEAQAPRPSIKKPCPTPRTSIIVSDDSAPSSRKNSDIPSTPYTGKRRKSGDLLARATSGSLQPDWPAENSGSKTGSYNMSNF